MANENCIRTFSGIEDALYAIGGKWRLRIIIALFDGACRFNEIQRAVSGISAKVLTDELRHLGLNGFIKRSAPDAPAMIHYELTEYSQTLRPVVHALHDWGKAHRGRIMRP
ncbi:MAG TPA: helix-turn-helix domain-containing protein [Puia sp.]|nr:helix-turn-helix domain-containing protein [Puia sp.]